MGSAEAESCVDEVGFFFFRMMKMGSVEAKAESCVDEVGFFTRDKFEYTRVGRDMSTTV